MPPSKRRTGKNQDEGFEPIDASLWGISDSELLAIIDDLADENGWTASYDVRIQVGEHPEEVGYRSGIGSRLAWMRRYGWLERAPDDGRWRLTAMGHAILDNPNLSKSIEGALEKLNPAQRLRLAREIAEYSHNSPDEIRSAMARQWKRSIGR